MTSLQNYLSPQEYQSAKAAKILFESRRTSIDEFLFRGSAKAIQSIHHGEFIIAGPAETGKTIATLTLLDILCRRYKNLQVAMARKIRNDMSDTVLRLYERKIMRDDVKKYGGIHPELYEYSNGSTISIGGMDRPGRILSGAFDAVYVNQSEELDLEDWESFSTRTTGRAGVLQPGLLFGDANPGPPTHWILHRPSLQLFHSKHEDNPALYDDDGNITEQGKRTMQILDALTGVRLERLRYGRWVAAEGTVYDFQPAIHEIDSFPIPKDGRRICIIDFGYVNPFVCQWWYIDNDDRAYLYREIYMTQRTVRVHSEQIKQLSEGEFIEVYIADHDAEDRATLEENGIYAIPADKDISPGIQSMQERMKLRVDGRPGLFVMRGALVERDEALAASHKPVCTRDEFDVYAFPKDSSGKSIKEAPVKLFDHGMDAARYLCRYLSESTGALFYE